MVSRHRFRFVAAHSRRWHVKAVCLLLLTGMGMSSGCAMSFHERSVSEHEAEIRRLWERSSVALCSGDWDGYRRLWATGAEVELLHPAGGEWIVGADSIMAGYRSLMESGFRCSYRTLDFRVSMSNDATVAWARVDGLLSAADQDSQPQRSWYTLVFERTAGEWRLVHAHASVVPATD